MPLEVIGVGLGRTGTHSTYHALNRLGFKCYHMLELLENPANTPHLKFWDTVARNPEKTEHNWNLVFLNYDACIDSPASGVWQQLWHENPEAKLILTIHPQGAEAWYDSIYSTIYSVERRWEFRFLSLFSSRARCISRICRSLLWKGLLHDSLENKAHALQRYRNHIEEIKHRVPQEKLLIYSVDQGWKPLCKFLNLPIPDTHFPHSNSREEMVTYLAQPIGLARRFLAVFIVVLVSTLWILGLLMVL